jgi:malonate decarboxylase gamma subunit
VQMGAVDALWDGDLAQRLRAALADATAGDRRRELGFDRGGRKLAAQIVERVVNAKSESTAAGASGG